MLTFLRSLRIRGAICHLNTFLSDALQGRKAAMRLSMVIITLLATNLLALAQVVFDNTTDTGPPPSYLGPYYMSPVIDNTNANGSLTNSIPLPNGNEIQLNDEYGNGTNPLTVVSPGTFFPWGNGYSGKAYGNLDSKRIRIYLPKGVKAFYLYAKTLLIAGNITVTANTDRRFKAEGTKYVYYTDAQFFGFHVTNPDDEISYVVVESDSPTPYAGEFGIAFECTDSAPYLTATNKELTCTNPSSTLTAPAGGINYIFTGPNNFSKSGTSNRVSVSEPGTYSLVATLAGGCTARGTVTITEDKTIPSSLFINDGPLTCAKTSVTLKASNQNNSGFAAYVFSGPDGFSQAGGSSTASVSVPGTYSLIIQSTNGCLSTERTTLVTSNTNEPTAATQPLFDLYNATGGANWTRKDNWLTGCSPCGWYGVSCDGNGRVTALNLPNNNLSGTIPASLSSLRALQRLNLTGNKLTGSIPTSLFTLTSLQSLELGSNPLTGGIPTGISSLAALQTLDLSRTQLDGTIPVSLGQLSQLRTLLLNENALTGSLPASLANLGQLQNLQLYGNQLSGCFPANYTSLCGRSAISFANNPDLPGGGDFAAFCRDGTGSELVVSQYPQSGSACVGRAFSFSVVARGAGSYQWYKDSQRLAESGPVLSFNSVSASDAGSYQVYINYGCGNGAVQSEVVTLAVASPVANLSNDGPLSCAKTSVQLAAGNGEQGTTYRFSGPNGFLQSGSGTAVNVSQPGFYSLTVITTAGCSATATTSVGENKTPPQNVQLTSSGTLSANNPTVTLTATSNATANVGVSYAFSPPAQKTTDNRATVTTSGTYSVTATRADNGCSATTATTVLGAASTTACRGTSTTITLTPAGSPSRYEWYIGVAVGQPLRDGAYYQGTATASLRVVSVSQSQIYYAKVFYADGSSVVYGPYRVTMLTNCGAREAATVEPGTELRITVLGNPLTGDVLRAVVTGAAGQRLSVELVDVKGQSVRSQVIESAESAQLVEWSLSGSVSGLYLLQAVSGNQRHNVKVMKP